MREDCLVAALHEPLRVQRRGLRGPARYRYPVGLQTMLSFASQANLLRYERTHTASY
jgi:hypothetical protein